MCEKKEPNHSCTSENYDITLNTASCLFCLGLFDRVTGINIQRIKKGKFYTNQRTSRIKPHNCLEEN